MASSIGMAIKLVVDLGGLKRGLDQATNEIKSFGNTIGRLAKVAVAAWSFKSALSGIQSIANWADELVDSAARIGESAGRLAAFDYAARMNGAESGIAAITKLQDAISNAADGGGPAAAAFQRLGVSARELKSLSPVEQMLRLADAFAAIQNPADRVRLAMDLFGKSGAQLLPILQGGREGIREMIEEGMLLGTIPTDETIQKLGEVADAFDKMGAGIKTLFAPLAAFVGGILQEIMEKLLLTQRRLKTVMEYLLDPSKWDTKLQDIIDESDQRARREAEEITSRREGEAAAAGPTPEEIKKNQDAARKRIAELDARERERQDMLEDKRKQEAERDKRLLDDLFAGEDQRRQFEESAKENAEAMAKAMRIDQFKTGSVGTFNTAAAADIGRSTKNLMQDIRDETKRQTQLQEETNRILGNWGMPAFA